MGIPTELISLIFGTAGGFAMQYMATKAKMQADFNMQALKANQQTTENQDKALARSNDASGNWVRRTLAICSLFAVVFLPAFMAIVGISTFTEISVIQPETFFGFVPETVRTYFVEIPGNLLTVEVRSTLTAICGFYLGSGIRAAK